MRLFRPISTWIDQRYSKPLMLGLSSVVLGFFWVFNFSKLPISNAQFIKLSSHEGLLDTMFWYSAQDAFMAITHYGQEGRNLYPAFIAADFVFILFYSFALAFLMTATVRSVCINGSSWLTLNLLPLGIGILDSIENISVLGLVKLYPVQNIFLGTLAGTVTLFKWLLTIVTVCLLLYGGILMFLHRLGLKRCVIQR